VILAASLALAQDLPQPAGDLRELDHPRYVDEAGVVYRWDDVRAMSDRDARRKVTARRVGRAVLEVAFASVTALEVWGTAELVERRSILAAPLGIQAGFTGVAGVLLLARAPSDARRDRAILVGSVNQ
jgi:hypothetical protein